LPTFFSTPKAVVSYSPGLEGLATNPGFQGDLTSTPKVLFPQKDACSVGSYGHNSVGVEDLFASSPGLLEDSRTLGWRQGHRWCSRLRNVGKGQGFTQGSREDFACPHLASSLRCSPQNIGQIRRFWLFIILE
jgi:hypothetical protein